MNHAAAAVDFLIQLYTTVFAKLPAFKVVFQSILHVSRPPSTKMGGDAAAWMGEMVENFPLEALSSANPVLSFVHNIQKRSKIIIRSIVAVNAVVDCKKRTSFCGNRISV